MCGIHGFVTGKKRNNNADDYVKQGFVAGSLRGMDSAGMASIKPKDKAASWQKLPLMGPFFIQDRFAQGLMREASTPNTITICHTRAATSGSIGIMEAHPFSVEGVADDEGNYRELVGVHNGTLQYWNSKKNAKDYKVDSEWALNHIFDHGMKAFDDFEGAYVFVWWDSADPDMLNIALNTERPMYVGFTDDEGMAYASEPGMLAWLCERNSIKLEGPITKLSAGHWYKFAYNDLTNFHKEKLPAKAAIKSQSSTASGPYSYRYRTDVEKVTDLFTTLTPASKGETVVRNSRSTVLPDEILVARELQLMNERAKFQPMATLNSGDVEGIITLTDGTTYNAVMRDGDWYRYDDTTVWDVNIIGAKDDGTNIELVTGRPYGIVKSTQRISDMPTQIGA